MNLNLRLEVRRLDGIVESRLRFLDTIRDRAVRGLYWQTQVLPFWILADALRYRLEN